MRRDNARVRVISVSIRDGNFDKLSHQMTMDNATSITNELYGYAVRIFNELWDGRPIRALGVHTSGISKDEAAAASYTGVSGYTPIEIIKDVINCVANRRTISATFQGIMKKVSD